MLTINVICQPVCLQPNKKKIQNSKSYRLVNLGVKTKGCVLVYTIPTLLVIWNIKKKILNQSYNGALYLNFVNRRSMIHTFGLIHLFYTFCTQKIKINTQHFLFFHCTQNMLQQPSVDRFDILEGINIENMHKKIDFFEILD